jgi:glycosyltransferase involved in cell wall biosynthesis
MHFGVVSAVHSKYYKKNTVVYPLRSDVIKKTFYYWHFHKNNFTNAVVNRIKQHGKFNDLDAWAYYRLGMYVTVTNMPYSGLKWRGMFAKIVSFAACGKHEHAKKLIGEMDACSDCHLHFVELADSLAPFMPEQAFMLLERTVAPVTLWAALLMEVGQTLEAKKILSEAILKKEGRNNPELFLYSTNAMEVSTPQKKLMHLNRFLVTHKVPKVRLKDKTLPPVPTNVKCSSTKKHADGPLVSILMTTFQTSHRADVAIESVLGQSYKNIELIVVDDASSDDTPELIESWVKRDSRVKFIKLDSNVGTFVAKNIGLQHAKGMFVTCHDSDDWSHPLKIELQMQPLLKNKRLIATTSYWVRIDDDGLYYARPVHSLMRVNPSSPLFRRKEVLQHAGIWDCVRTGADSEFLVRLRLVFGKKAIKKIKKPLSLGAHRADSLMTANDTGYCDSSISPQRLAYWESWNKWHINELSAKKKPYLSTELLAERKFEAPEAILVPKDDIEKLLNRFGISNSTE